MVGARRITNKKLREHQYREGYAKSLDGKGVEWDGENNVENIWKQVNRTMVESAREVYGPMKVEGKNPKSAWWNDEVKAAVRRKEAAWKEVLAASDEEAKERWMEAYKEEETKVRLG